MLCKALIVPNIRSPGSPPAVRMSRIVESDTQQPCSLLFRMKQPDGHLVRPFPSRPSDGLVSVTEGQLSLGNS
jgi:hypothetical protein